MSSKRSRLKLACAALAMVGLAGSADAALNVFQTFNGTYGLSTDGGGSLDNSYGVSAFVPVGATVSAAYLYQATNNTTDVQAITLNGNAVTFGPRVPNATACCALASARADVTSLVASVVNGGAGGTYNFTVGESGTNVTDGTALVVVYSLASLATSTVAILDGFASVDGDVTTVNFADPLDPTDPNFVADLRIGSGFSFPPQSSTIEVNGTQITANAGGFDDGESGNGALITVGGNDDPFSAFEPGYDEDHERYNLASYITPGSTSLTIRTSNASEDDNIFFAGLVITGNAGINEPPPGVPEPASWAMMLAGFGLVGGMLRRRSAAGFAPAT
jgi:hypothetical protein